MRKMIAIIVLALGSVAFAEDPPTRVPATPAEIQRAASDHKLIDGMTFRQAGAALKPVRPEVIRAGGRIVSALWVVPDRGESAVEWSCTVDPDMTIWDVMHKHVRLEPNTDARKQRQDAARRGQRQ